MRRFAKRIGLCCLACTVRFEGQFDSDADDVLRLAARHDDVARAAPRVEAYTSDVALPLWLAPRPTVERVCGRVELSADAAVRAGVLGLHAGDLDRIMRAERALYPRDSTAEAGRAALCALRRHDDDRARSLARDMVPTYSEVHAVLADVQSALPRDEVAIPPPSPPALPELTPGERDDIRNGLLVTRKSVVFRSRRKYVGGLAFRRVHAPPKLVLDSIFSADAAASWMPETLSAVVVGGGGDHIRVRFEQGEKPFVATHTLHFWRDDLAIRWKLDPTERHDIEDAWGFLSATDYGEGECLLTLGILIDLGDGVVRAFAEGDIQHTVLATPDDIRDYVEMRRFAPESVVQQFGYHGKD